MPERAFAVDAPDGREAQVTETGNQPRRLRLTGVVGIGSLGRTCERLRSHTRVLNTTRARSFDGPTRTASDDRAARGCARLIPDAFPRRLRLSPSTSWGTASVRRRWSPQLHALDGLTGAEYLTATWITGTHSRPYGRPHPAFRVGSTDQACEDMRSTHAETTGPTRNDSLRRTPLTTDLRAAAIEQQ